MIDIATDELISIREAARLVPGRRGRRGVHPTTVYRWIAGTPDGTRLETVMIGGSRYTTLAAMREFAAACAARADASRDSAEEVAA